MPYAEEVADVIWFYLNYDLDDQIRKYDFVRIVQGAYFFYGYDVPQSYIIENAFPKYDSDSNGKISWDEAVDFFVGFAKLKSREGSGSSGSSSD